VKLFVVSIFDDDALALMMPGISTLTDINITIAIFSGIIISE